MGLITQSHRSFDEFGQAFHGKSDGYGYARYFYTNEREIEEEFARYAGLEDAALFNSGMAGIVTLMETLKELIRSRILHETNLRRAKKEKKPIEDYTLLGLHARDWDQNTKIIVSSILYSQTLAYFKTLGFPSLDVGDNDLPRPFNCIEFIDPSDAEKLISHFNNPISPNVVVFLETIGNGYEMPVADLPLIFAGLQKAICKDRIYLVIDNTFLTTTLFDVLALARKYGLLGKVIVVESATKYYQRGGDKITAGLVFGPKRIIQKVKERRALMGTYLQPMCIDQLPICSNILHREVMPRHSRNALKFARFLERQPQVCEVKYPLLPSHPQYELARKMFPSGAGGLFFFKLRGGKTAAKKFVNSLGYCQIGGSFGHDTTWVTPLDAVKDGDTGIIRVAAGFKRGDRKETICDFERALRKL